MKFHNKVIILVILSIAFVGGAFLLKRLPQSLSYHNFADRRSLWGIPNFANVVTNFSFLLTGFYGLYLLSKNAVQTGIMMAYIVLCTGILLTGIGSGYYHLHPDNNTLVWDRVPMTIVFMAFLSAIISEFISLRLGKLLLLPLLLLGIGSVLWWHYTELSGQGDLRLYGVVQFYPVLFIPVIMLLFATPASRCLVPVIVWIILWYVLAKLFEHFDREIFTTGHFVSGHSLKHIAAAVATGYIVSMFGAKYFKKPENQVINLL